MPLSEEDQAKARDLSEEAEFGYEGTDVDGWTPVQKRLMETVDPMEWARAFKYQFEDEAPDEATMATWFKGAMFVGASGAVAMLQEPEMLKAALLEQIDRAIDEEEGPQ